MKNTFNTDTIKKIVLLLSFIGLVLGFQNLNHFALGEPNGRNNVNSTSTIMFNMDWNQTFGGLAADGARSLIGTSDGGYAIAGCTYSYGAGNGDLWLVKTDANGQAQWNTTYGGKNVDAISHLCTDTLIQTADGGFVLFGWTRSFGAGDMDFWLIKTDANGQAEWNTTYGGVLTDWPGSFIQTADGGYALVGWTDSYGTGGDAWLVKTDANGQAEWNKTYGGGQGEGAFSIIQTADGGFALAGTTDSYGAGNIDGWLVKTDVNGQAQWNYTYGGIESDSTSFLIQLADGGYILAGNSESYGGPWLLKTDATGQVLWNYTYGAPTPRDVFSLIQTADGGYALTGWIAIEGSGKAEDCWLIKIDANGQMVWEKIFGGKKTDIGNDLLQAADGDLVIAGWTGSYGAGNSDMWLLKTPDSPPSPAASGLEVIPLLFAVSVLVFWRRWKK